MEEYILLFLLFACLIIEEISHKRERRDLYNRLMARDLSEYRKPESKEKKDPYVSKHKQMIEAWRKGESIDGS